jgi:hypothetical protein
MSEIKGLCSHDVAVKLAAKGPVKAQVQGRDAVVWANAWEPTTETETGPEAKHFVRAREIRTDVRDVEAEGTQQADTATQQLINDSVSWEPWR